MPRQPLVASEDVPLDQSIPQSKTATSWTGQKMVRRLKSRLGLALREMHRTGVVKEEDMPEPEEILALRICSPYAEFNGTIATLLLFSWVICTTASHLRAVTTRRTVPPSASIPRLRRMTWRTRLW
jgi:hypothetical protein